MRTPPITIDNVDGDVVVATNWRGTVGIYVDGKAATESGRDRWRLPAKRGADREAHLIIKFWQVFPTLVVDSAEHRTGPKTPVPLILLAGFPLILLLPAFGWYGIFFGAATALLNQSALRESTNLWIRIGRIGLQNVISFTLFALLHAT